MLEHKKPIHNEEGNVIGVFTSSNDITNLIFKKYNSLNLLDKRFTSNLKHKKYILTSEFSPLSLTKKQKECLAWVIRGKTNKEIVYLMGISCRTVDEHIQKMKLKLDCNSKSQLIEKAIDSGFLLYVP
ncbi:MAG: helix-turn-helix transcriptional regulator [Rickettsiaceae bacterium]|nr:helix-turn-helix transcriptional regulator [Rickettsiaceae bacterium]